MLAWLAFGTVLEEWKICKDIVASNPPDVAIQLLLDRIGPPYSTDPMYQLLVALSVMTGGYREFQVSVPMDNVDEDHGFYEVFMNVSFP